MSVFPRFLIFSFLLFLSFAGFAQTDLARWQQRAAQTEIIRDQWGVPHVYGKTDADAVFGMVYAQCEDDFTRVESNYINAMGRMAEVKGVSHVYHDLRMKLFIDEDIVKEEFKNSPKWLQELMVAWADGINFYLHSNPEVKPLLITKFEPWMALTFSEGSIGGDIETIALNPLRSFYEKGEPSAIALEERDFEIEPKGSNGFAIAPQLTQNGDALLLINPHTSFYFRPEMHMVSEEGLNAYGAVTWGQFFIYQGFNEYNSWIHTSSKADAIDHYALTMEEKEGKYHYRFGEDWRPLKEKTITLKYKDGDGFSEKKIVAYYSHHGPVIREENGKWIAISLMVERVKALTQSYTRTKTKNHQEFRSTMDLKTNSSNNTVYADRDGNIAYYHGNFIPKRNPDFDWRNTVDGSNPDTDWQGLHSLDEMIFIFNPRNGWIQNCNSTPFTAAGRFSPKKENFPAYMAWDLENARGLNAVRVLEDQKNLTLESLITIAYEPTLMAFKPLVPSLVKAFENLPDTDLRKILLLQPLGVLASWDLKTGVESVGTTLGVFWANQLMADARDLERPWDAYIFDFLAKETSDEMKIAAFEKALERLKSDFGTWEMPWGEVNRFQRISGEIEPRFDDTQASFPVGMNSSMWGSLAAYGSRPYPNTKKWYGNVGNSFVAVVEFGEKVKAKSLLAGGQSGDPSSPHFTDQAEMYALGKFKDVSFYREDVLKNTKKTYRPGEK
ncbi:Penicillin amidase family protein [Mariniradius saccharolyticus AK6]|uniref:Penicillin amidase family protein n=1 Tax=Mariniradius saccharolyticus AK6 TaxID=1239962 RepID=M7XYN6_9BACT|nr:penicillin acylase family protein [Mariniradius saccharolyticus]EMS33607.1 Penicillin amidase family protein [Mariniradius saccharolyticus AK6]